MPTGTPTRSSSTPPTAWHARTGRLPYSCLERTAARLSPEAGFEDYLTHSGKQADIVLLRADTLHHAPLNNITARLGVL